MNPYTNTATAMAEGTISASEIIRSGGRRRMKWGTDKRSPRAVSAVGEASLSNSGLILRADFRFATRVCEARLKRCDIEIGYKRRDRVGYVGDPSL